MGHRQQMTDKARLEWDIKQYKARLESKRGHNYQYMTDALYQKLITEGFVSHSFSDINYTYSEQSAIEAKKYYTEKKLKAKIICVGNKLRIKTFEV